MGELGGHMSGVTGIRHRGFASRHAGRGTQLAIGDATGVDVGGRDGAIDGTGTGVGHTSVVLQSPRPKRQKPLVL